MAEAIQSEKLSNTNEIKGLKGTAASLRDELEKSKFDMAEGIQSEKLSNTNEIKGLKGTVASLREELEKK
jgi:predicted RNA-binding protein with EMAP domain